MANSHPYISGPGNIAQMIEQLRKNFPAMVSADTVKKLGLAPKNESYVINALQFVGVIDDDNKKTPEAGKVFVKHKDEDFASSFSKMVKSAYHALFDLHGEEAWGLNKEELITFFRQSDQTSDAIGARQASTFQVFAALSGHGDLPAKKASTSSSTSMNAAKNSPKPKKTRTAEKKVQNAEFGGKADINSSSRDIGLSVKVEINLPSDASAETYDNIFKSIRKNLLDG